MKIEIIQEINSNNKIHLIIDIQIYEIEQHLRLVVMILKIIIIIKLIIKQAVAVVVVELMKMI